MNKIRSLLVFFCLLLGSINSGLTQSIPWDSIKQLDPKERIVYLDSVLHTDIIQDSLMGKIYHELGSAHYKNDETLEAIKWTTKASQIRKSICVNDYVVSLFNLALYHQIIQDCEAAVDYYHQIINIPDNRKMGVTYYQLGRSYRVLGEYKLAAESMLSARQLPPFQSDDFLASILDMELGDIYVTSGDSALAESAMKVLQSAYKYYQIQGDIEKQILCLNRMGLAALHREDFSRSDELFKKGLKKIKICCEESEMKTWVLNNLGILNRRSGRPKEAIGYYKSIIQWNNKHIKNNSALDRSIPYENIARVYLDMNKLDLALRYSDSSIIHIVPNYLESNELSGVYLAKLPFKRSFLNKLKDRWQLQYALWHNTQNQEFRKGCIRSLQEGQMLIKAIRSQQSEVESKLTLSLVAKEMYAMLIELSSQLGDDQMCFRYCQQSQHSILHDELIRRKVESQLPDSIRWGLSDLRRTIKLKEKQNYIADSDSSFSDVVRDKQKIDNIYRDYLGSMTEDQTLELEAFRSNIPTNMTVLSYHFISNQIYIWNINSEGYTLTQVDQADSIKRMCLEYYESIISLNKDNRKQMMAKLSYELHQTLLQNVGELKENLLIVPDGELHYVPFSSLTTKELSGDYFLERAEFLVNQKNISYLPSLRQIQTTSEIDLDRMNIGIVSMHGEQSDLIHAEKEVNYIRKNYPVTEHSNLTSENIFRHFEKANVLHFATHSEVNDSLPYFSKINIAPQEDLYLKEIWGRDLNKDLIVLASCQSAFGKVNSGEGIHSLGLAFYTAACPSVLMTMWKVDDYSTSDIIIDFYNHLESENIANSLSHAQRSWINKSSPVLRDPYYWAGMLVLSSPSEQTIEDCIPIWIFLTLLIFLLLVFYIGNAYFSPGQRLLNFHKRQKSS